MAKEDFFFIPSYSTCSFFSNQKINLNQIFIKTPANNGHFVQMVLFFFDYLSLRVAVSKFKPFFLFLDRKSNTQQNMFYSILSHEAPDFLFSYWLPFRLMSKIINSKYNRYLYRSIVHSFVCFFFFRLNIKKTRSLKMFNKKKKKKQN